MLLEGWRMLAQICPLCSSPLMSKDGGLHCPGCDLPVRYESQQVNGNDGRFDDAEEEDGDDAALVPFSSLEEMKREYDSRNKAQELVSKKLGEKMLSGWTLLGVSCEQESCRGTPLMQSQKEPGKMLCVACDREYRQNKQGGLEPFSAHSTSSSLARSVSTTASPSSASLREGMVPSASVAVAPAWDMSDAPILDFSRTAREQDSSSRIAARLVQGWALLNEVCEAAGCDRSQGAVPLMRDGQGVKHCVDCGFRSSPAGGATTSMAGGVNSTNRVGGGGGGVGGTGNCSVRRRRGDRDVVNTVEDGDDDDEIAFQLYAAQRLAGLDSSSSSNNDIPHTHTHRAPPLPPSPSIQSQSQSHSLGNTTTHRSTGSDGIRKANTGDDGAEETEALRLVRERLLAAARSLHSGGANEAADLAVLVDRLAQAVTSLKRAVN